jgi:hypothetical protein
VNFRTVLNRQQAIKLGKVGYVYSGSGHENLSTQTEEGEGCLPAEDRSRGAPFVGEVGRPGPTGLGGRVPLPASAFFQHDHSPPCPPCPRAPRVAPPKRSHPLLSLHYWSFHLMLHALGLSMLPSSTCFTCHYEILAKSCLLPTHACPLHVVLMKVDERVCNGACMINLN